MKSEDPSLPKLVVFCGAGFSMSAGLPSMLSFSHAVRACRALNEASKFDFDAVQVA